MGCFWLPNALFVYGGQWIHHSVIKFSFVATHRLLTVAWRSCTPLVIILLDRLIGSKALHFRELIPYLVCILAVELSSLLEIFLSLLCAEEGDCRIVSCLLGQNHHVQRVFKSFHIN